MEATILIPTFRHPQLLPYSIESALRQTVTCEIMVIGDGVEDDTRAALTPYLSRIRFFDMPKGERNGEQHRHYALQCANSRVICYLGDDDLLLPEHCAEMVQLLEDADFAHSYPVFVRDNGDLSPGLVDLRQDRYRQAMLDGECQVSLTGAAHTLDMYWRLPFGWRPAPPDVWSDLFMWQQILGERWVRAVTSDHCTHLKLSANARAEMSDSDRVQELRRWADRMREPGFSTGLQKWLKPYVRVSRRGASSRTGSHRNPARS